MTQRDVAVGIGRDQSIVSRWEAGWREPTPNDLASLGRLLEVRG